MQVKLNLRAIFLNKFGARSSVMGIQNSLLYRTPSENVYGYGIHASVRELVSEISNKNFVLFGDFFSIVLMIARSSL